MTIFNMEEEIWKDIPQFKEAYQASTHGRIKSLERVVIRSNGTIQTFKERILKSSVNSKGYKVSAIYFNKNKKVLTVSVLVAMTFLDHIPNGHKIVVDHIDNVKTNDFLSNLQLITNRENASKDRKGYTSKFVGVSFAKEREKWLSRIRINDKITHLGYFDSEIEASSAYQNKLKQL